MGVGSTRDVTLIRDTAVMTTDVGVFGDEDKSERVPDTMRHGHGSLSLFWLVTRVAGGPV